MRGHRYRSDYSRVETEIDSIQDEIEFETGQKFRDLSKEEQRQVLLDHFFKGLPKYKKSAEEMRVGLKAYGEGAPAEIKVGKIRRGQRSYTVIRDAKTGRIRQWVKE